MTHAAARRLVVAVVAVGAVGASALVTFPAHADQYEAQWSLRPMAGFAEVREEGAPRAAGARVGGGSLGVSYGLANYLDVGVELIGWGSTPATFADTTLAVERGNLVTGTFTRRSSSTLLLAGPTWRLGVAWVPVITVAAGAGTRVRSDGSFSELMVFPSERAATLALDLAAMTRVGLEYRMRRRVTVGAYAYVLTSWGPSAPTQSLGGMSLGVSYVYYPRW